MTYTKENIKYCLLSFDAFQQKFQEQFTSKSPAITGLFQWAKAFNGKMDFPRTAEQFSKYNLIHVNITPGNLNQLPRIIPLIKEAGAKLLVNVDYAIELWNNNFNFPEMFLEQLNRADYIFAVEENMANLLELHLKRRVPCIPHPTDVQGIGSMATLERDNVIGIHVHRYDKNYLLPWYAINHSNIDRNKYLTCLIGGSCNYTEVSHLYDTVLDHTPFPELMKITSKLLVAMDTYTIYSYGRYTTECAALAVPCISSETVSSARKLFPDLITKNNDVKDMNKKLYQLLNDQDFYNHVVMKAQDKVSYYSKESCSKMLLDYINS